MIDPWLGVEVDVAAAEASPADDDVAMMRVSEGDQKILWIVPHNGHVRPWHIELIVQSIRDLRGRGGAALAAQSDEHVVGVQGVGLELHVGDELRHGPPFRRARARVADSRHGFVARAQLRRQRREGAHVGDVWRSSGLRRRSRSRLLVGALPRPVAGDEAEVAMHLVAALLNMMER